MKKHSIAILLPTLLMLLILPIRAHAHPGGTDSNGGHADSDTGDYHYHHGYPAHDHYDMNGDGVLDCPYDFDDQTEHSSCNSSEIASGIDRNRNTDTFHAELNSKQISLIDVIKAILEILPVALAIWLSSSYFLFYIFHLFFGDAQGCSIAIISGAVIALIASVWLVVSRLL